MSGQTVREKIEKLGIPLAEVARRLSISPQTLQKRLNVEDMKIGVLTEIATAINKSVYYFFEGSHVNVNTQVNDNAARYNTQNFNLEQGRTSGATNVNEVVEQLKQCAERLKEKDQIIADLRKTIQLYEQILNKAA